LAVSAPAPVCDNAKQHHTSVIITVSQSLIIDHPSAHRQHRTTSDMRDVRYDAWFALENWQASCPFNPARKLERTENVLNGNEIRDTETEELLCKI